MYRSSRNKNEESSSSAPALLSCLSTLPSTKKALKTSSEEELSSFPDPYSQQSCKRVRSAAMGQTSSIPVRGFAAIKADTDTPGLSELFDNMTTAKTVKCRSLVEILAAFKAENWSEDEETLGLAKAPPSVPAVSAISLLSLPNEILLEILEYLPSRDIRNMAGLSRHVAALTAYQTFDAALFRQQIRVPPIPTISNIQDVETHPVFNRIHSIKESEADLVLADRHGRETTRYLHQHTFWLQMATNPPVRSVRIKVAHLKTVETANKSGVRVCDVVRAICIYMSKEIKVRRSGVLERRMLSAHRSLRLGEVDRPLKPIDIVENTQRKWWGIKPSHLTNRGRLVVKAQLSIFP